MQTLHVAGNGLDVLVAQLRGDALHDLGVAVVGAYTFAEVGELLGDVLRVLTTQVLGAWQPVQDGMP